METVSIIIPVFNGEKYLDKTIKSCIEQSYPGIEIIVINDASTDNSLTIINGYTSIENIRIIHNECNQGLMYNLALGVKAAKGSKVLPIGQDDILEKKHVETAMKYFDDGVAFVFNNPTRIDANDNVGNRVISEADLNSMLGNLKLSISQNCCIPSTGILIDRASLIECGNYDIKYRNYGEWIVWIRLLSKYSCAYASDCSAYYRTHSDNLTSNQLKVAKISKELIHYQLYCQKLAIEILKLPLYNKAYLIVRYIVKYIRSIFPLW